MNGKEYIVMKKRIIAAMMSSIFIMGTAMPVGAEPAASGETQVMYNEGNNWNITIPATVDLYTDKGTSCSITASLINIEPRHRLEISVSGGISDGRVTLLHEDGTEEDAITSLVSLTEGAETGIEENEVVAEFRGSEFEGAITPSKGGTLYFSALEGDNIRAGEYSGTITFTMSVENDAYLEEIDIGG